MAKQDQRFSEARWGKGSYSGVGDSSRSPSREAKLAGSHPAFRFTYHVKLTPTGFSASCRELGLGSEGATIAFAVESLRAAIEHALGK